MSFGVVDMDEEGGAAAAADEIRRLPAEVNWEMLDKSRFFVLGAALFSGVSAALYPAVVVKTHLQVAPPPQAATATAAAILRRDGLRGFYRGFGASLAGTVPARALYMAALEATKSSVGSAAVRLGVSEPAARAAASAAGRLRRHRRAGRVDTRRRHQPAAHGPDLLHLPLPRRRGRLQEDPPRRRRPWPVPRLRPLHRDLRSIQRRVVGVLRHGAALHLARRRRRALGELPVADGRAGRERRPGRGRVGARDHAAGHRQDAHPGNGNRRRGGGAADAQEHGARPAQGRRVGGVLPRARAEVGIHVALGGHHGHHLRVLEAALGQGRVSRLEVSLI